MKLELEQQNFKIDSTGWTKKHDDWSEIDYLENPEKDIWEIASGESKGEQLFTWDAAIRETKKSGKRMPTDKEWSKLLETKSDMPKLNFTGSRNTDGSFNILGSSAFFWSSSQGGSSAWYRYLNSGNATVTRGLSSKANGFSVRCIKDKQPRDPKGRFKGKYEKAFNDQSSPLDIYNEFLKCVFGESHPVAISPIKVELQKTTYKLTHGEFELYASVGKKGKISIKKPNGFIDFVFEKSDPKTVKAIGELLIKASEL